MVHDHARIEEDQVTYVDQVIYDERKVILVRSPFSQDLFGRLFLAS